MTPARSAANVGVLVLAAVTLPTGGRMFAAAVLVWAVVVLIAVAELLARAGHRPVVPAAAVAALGVPGSVLVVGSTTWEQVPLILAAMVLVAFVLALIAPRRRDLTTTLSVTALAAAITGLGSAGMLVLRSASAGFRWTMGLLLLTVVPLVAATLAERSRDVSAALAVRVVSAGAIGGALLLALDTPFGVIVIIVLTALGLGAGWAAEALMAALTGASDKRGTSQSPVTAVLLAPLLAAPVAAFVALATSV